MDNNVFGGCPLYQPAWSRSVWLLYCGRSPNDQLPFHRRVWRSGVYLRLHQGSYYYGIGELHLNLDDPMLYQCVQIILGIVLDLGGGPNHDRIGFRYWKHPGPFNQFLGISGNTGRFLAWWSVMVRQPALRRVTQ